MMWFFAVLVVLALGGVAAVAAGRGRPMSVEYDDRPDVTVPADQALVEDDVRRVRFSTALLGYRQSEVDALLERLARELGLQAQRDADRAAAEAARREAEATAEPSSDPATDDAAPETATEVDSVPATSGAATWWSRRRGGRPRT